MIIGVLTGPVVTTCSEVKCQSAQRAMPFIIPSPETLISPDSSVIPSGKLLVKSRLRSATGGPKHLAGYSHSGCGSTFSSASSDAFSISC